MTTIQINLRTLKAVSMFARTEDARYYLNGVLIEGSEKSVNYVATDGHRLFARQETFENAGDNDAPFLGEIIIPIAECRAWKLGKRDDGWATLAVDGRKCTITYGETSRSFQAIDGTFPDWRRILPKPTEDRGAAQFNLDYLATFAKAGRELEIGLPYVAHSGAENPTLVTYTDGATFGVLMPMRAPAERRDVPNWTAMPRPSATDGVAA